MSQTALVLGRIYFRSTMVSLARFWHIVIFHSQLNVPAKALYTCSGKASYAVSFCPGDGGTHSQTSVSTPGSAPGSTGSDAAVSGTTSAPPTQTPPKLEDDAAPVAAIAGGVVAGVVALALVSFAFILWRRKRKSTDNAHASEQSGPGIEPRKAGMISPYPTHLQPGSGARGAAGVGYGGATAGAYGSSANDILGMRSVDDTEALLMTHAAGGKRAFVREWSGNTPPSGAAVASSSSGPTGFGLKLSAQPVQTNRADGIGTTYFQDESSPGGTVPLSAFALGHPSLPPVTESDSRVRALGDSPGTHNISSPGSVIIPAPGSDAAASHETAGGGGSSSMIIRPVTNRTASDGDAAALNGDSQGVGTDASTRAVIRERRPSQRGGGSASGTMTNPHQDFPPPAYSSIQYNGQSNG